jgi:alpha-beta hydrolase superfamily lysophospholipase
MIEFMLTSADGTSIRTGVWNPKGETKDRILLCHGLAEYIGRYDYHARWFAQRGYQVTAVELRGHGQSGGKRGHVSHWSDYVNDLSAAANHIEGDYFLLAHSMGSLVSLDFLRTHRVRAVATTGQLLGAPDDAPKLKMAAGRLLSRLIPGLPMDNELIYDHLCTDAAVVEAYRNDPLIHRTITPRWFTEMTKAAERVNAHAAAYEDRALFMWGCDDHIVPVNRIEPFAARYGGDRTTRAWPGLRHEILNEPCKDEVLGVIHEFFQA